MRGDLDTFDVRGIFLYLMGLSGQLGQSSRIIWVKNIGTAMEMYQMDHPGSYPKSLAGLTPNYLKILPECPAAQSDSYSSSYPQRPSSEVEPPYFRVSCRGSHHFSAGVSSADRPSYNSLQGLVER